jgi:DUF971 family protein
MRNKPVNIEVNRSSRGITITWMDEHVSTYSFSLLRHACPCAECRGGHANMASTPDEEVFSMPPEDSPRTRLQDLEAVGAYAITPYWEDGHQYGIYNWDYLRALCPCSQCRGDG